MRLVIRSGAAVMALVALAGGTSISEAAISAGPGRWTISYTTRLPMSSFLAAVAVSPRDIWAIGKFATSAGASTHEWQC